MIYNVDFLVDVKLTFKFERFFVPTSSTNFDLFLTLVQRRMPAGFLLNAARLVYFANYSNTSGLVKK